MIPAEARSRPSPHSAVEKTIGVVEWFRPGEYERLIELIAALHGERLVLHAADWRPGDQRYYASDTRRFRAATGWVPRVGVRQGLKRLYEWLLESRGLAAACPAVGEVAS